MTFKHLNSNLTQTESEKVLSMPMFKPGSLGQTVDALTNSSTPQLHVLKNWAQIPPPTPTPPTTCTPRKQIKKNNQERKDRESQIFLIAVSNP
jgi:hypothetical protein